MLVPKTALQVVVPRPGVPAEVQIGLVGGGDIEGAIVKSGGLGFEGLDLELVDGSGKVAATARTDFDGFFLFERVPYGNYRVRIAQSSAVAARIGADLGASAHRHRGKIDPSAGRDPRRASAGDRVGRGPRLRAIDPMLCWCGRENSNFHGLAATATSTLRVYQFRHDRTS